VHHASNVDYLDANYGGVLIVFDRLFGTYVAERDDLPCVYGLVKPMRSHNLLVVEFHQWMALARDLRRTKGWRACAGLLLRPPGWSPEGAHQTTEAMREFQGAGGTMSIKAGSGRLQSADGPRMLKPDAQPDVPAAVR
jgi:hypothetical protein